MIQIKAAVFHGPKQMSIEVLEKPQIGPKEVLLQVTVSAVCGTDVRIYEGLKTKGVRTPSTIGHEVVGIVESVGSEISEFKPGDRVGVIPVIPCRKCHYCLNGRENACLNRKAIGYEFDGAFAEFVRIPREAIESGNLVHLPDELPFEQAVLCEPLSCCINGQRKAQVKINDCVVVVGAGPIGLMHVQLAKIAGARKVIVSELVESRRENAAEAGADVVVNPLEQSLEQIVKDNTEGYGADAVILAIGVPSLVNPSLRLLRKGGVLNLFAGFTNGVSCEIDPNFIHYEEVKVVGTSASTRSDYMNALGLIRSGAINTDVLITPGYTLDGICNAINDVKSGTGMKPVINY
ncbi:zinc-dependent dehydrogenase [Alicyclobacillus fastidiosus]|uniref:Zinc-dependent dehydrogenase n=1 Tax=Alicyclobacillus fastidiosus TaxID=392011 RepID=A0ABV5ABD1_9BACL|nr:zinc-dependent dehydrogenase [Alicyclobacillus fastidiosus]WEH10463.1 zinc-dependent dehydrogenase [Alicyclobacillus fastidiosus]